MQPDAGHPVQRLTEQPVKKDHSLWETLQVIIQESTQVFPWGKGCDQFFKRTLNANGEEQCHNKRIPLLSLQFA